MPCGSNSGSARPRLPAQDSSAAASARAPCSRRRSSRTCPRPASPTESSGWHREWPLGLALAALALALLGRDWIGSTLDQPAGLILRLVVICLVILIAAFAIVRHADVLAHRLGEPAGTLLLTLAITGLEGPMGGLVISNRAPQ